jgi:hypothetical protein
VYSMPNGTTSPMSSAAQLSVNSRWVYWYAAAGGGLLWHYSSVAIRTELLPQV